eukprot:scaffold178_cov163-Amphora_coffeaeformis.AAC.3
MGYPFIRVNRLVLVALLASAIYSPLAEGFSLQRPSKPTNAVVVREDVDDKTTGGRRAFLGVCTSIIFSSAMSGPTQAIAIPEQKTYSSNARNLDRLSTGDQSGGSVYDNNPKSPAGAKRRAMLGCKVSTSRKQAGGYSEKDCNAKVLSGETEFMLEALRTLDCPTCPYGIKGA